MTALPLLFILFSLFIWGIGTGYNGNGESEYPWLVPNLRATASKYFTIKYDVSCDFSWAYIIRLRKFPLFLIWWEFLSWRSMEFCQAFFCIYWNNDIISPYVMLIWWITLIFKCVMQVFKHPIWNNLSFSYAFFLVPCVL